MRVLFFQICFFLVLLSFSPALTAQRQMEKLDRGVVAVKNGNSVFISWRFLATDNPLYKFNVYKNGTQKINLVPIATSTNVVDNSIALVSDTYTVRTILNGVEIDTSEAVNPWPAIYKTIPLQRPASGTNKSGSYSYTPNDCSVGDLNGDGKYEIILKWDPSNSKDNSQSGYTGNVYIDAYEMDGTHLWRIDLGVNIRAGAHYTQFMVYDLDGDGISEVACKTAPGTIDGKGRNVLMNNDVATNDYRNSSGYILSGPEYLTVFDGQTGAEMNTVAYNPQRGSVNSWGDDYGNRVDRFLACIAYLDGIHPSLVMCRGYYTRTTLAAYDLVNGKLVQRWFHDSPTSGSGAYGQGNHNLTVGDADGDDKDEIIYGACAINDDGKLMYRTGLGHGDAMHLSDMDPDVDGLEVWEIHESVNAAYGYELHNAGTGNMLWGTRTSSDNGRGLAADISSASPGFEMWSSSGSGIYSCKGVQLSTNKPSTNFRIYWDGDLQDELLDGTKLDKWNGNGTDRLLTIYNYGNAKEINGTKANPCLSADLIGDWREEMIYFDGSDFSKLLLFTTTTFTGYRLYTLMHDPLYRLSVAWQNVVYNQPPHLSFYIGGGIGNIPWPNIYTPEKNTVTQVKKATIYDFKVLSVEDGSVFLSSGEMVRSVSVYSITGVLLYRENNIFKNECYLPIKKDHSVKIVKVETESGLHTLKVVH